MQKRKSPNRPVSCQTFVIVFTFYFGTGRNTTNFLLISAPLFAAGILFLLSAKDHAG